jgi:hypothetical protein
MDLNEQWFVSGDKFGQLFFLWVQVMKKNYIRKCQKIKITTEFIRLRKQVIRQDVQNWREFHRKFQLLETIVRNYINLI